jgi:hypothetical protein
MNALLPFIVIDKGYFCLSTFLIMCIGLQSICNTGNTNTKQNENNSKMKYNKTVFRSGQKFAGHFFFLST